MPEEPISEESLKRRIVETIEGELSLDPSYFEIEMHNGELFIQGEVPSIQDREILERLLFDTMGLENVEFDVIVDEDLQSEKESFDEDISEEEFEFNTGQPDLNDIQGRPRRQY